MEKYFRLPFLLIFIIFPLGQLTRLNILSPEIHLHLLDLVACLTIPVGIYFLLTQKLTFAKFPFVPPYIFFLLVLPLSLVVNLQILSRIQILTSSLYILRIIAYSSLFISTYYALIFRPALKEFLKIGLVFIILTLCVISILQYFFLPDLRPLEIFNWDPHLYRVVGPFLDPGFTGIILTLGIIFILINFGNQISTFTWANFYLHTTLALAYVSLAFTYSRASYLAFLVSLVTWGVIQRNRKFIFLILVLFTITLIALPRRDSIGTQLDRQDSVKARIQNWRNSIVIIKDHPFLGVGFNSYRYAQRRYGFLKQAESLSSHSGAGGDSSLLFTWGTTGIVGFAFLIWFLSKLYTYFSSIHNFVVPISLIAILVHSIFQNSLYYPWVLAWFSLLAAVSLPSSKARK